MKKETLRGGGGGVQNSLLTLAAVLVCLGTLNFSSCSNPSGDGGSVQTPRITVQPQKAVYAQNAAEVTPLRVVAEVTDGGALTYQWYTTDGITSDEVLDGAASADYTPPVSEPGTTYYYVVITNTSGGGKADVKSDTTKVKVNTPGAPLAQLAFAVAESAAGLENATLTEFTEDRIADFTAGLGGAISGAAGGWSVDEPVYVKINGLDVSDMADLALLYGNLSPSKYVDLDLSGCLGSAVPIAQGTDAYKAQKSKITGITYPASIERIEDSADWSGTGGGLAIPYKNFTALKRVSLPGALYIGNRAFYKITTLETLDAPKVRVIGPYAFGDYIAAGGNKFTELNLPEVRVINEGAFRNCNKLKTLEMPNVEYIGDGAFYVEAANIDISETLTELNLPNVLEIVSTGTAVTSAPTTAFNGRPIEDVYLPRLVKFAGFPAASPFITAAIAEAVSAGTDPLEKVLELAPNASIIGTGAFYGVTTLTGNITIPERITEIGDYAFDGCVNIESVSGANVITIGTGAFYRVNSTATTQPDGALTAINFPKAVTVKTLAFQYQRWLASVNLPKAETIGGNAFAMSGNTATTSNAVLISVSLPSAVSLGASTQEAFVNCVNLETIELGASVPLLLATTKFTSISTSYHIDVPAAVLPAYQAACDSGAKGWTSTLAGKLQTY